MFLYWKMNLLYIFNVVKDITHNFIRGIFKITMQSLKVWISYCKTYRIENIMLKNASLHNLDIIQRLRVADRIASPNLSQKVELLLLPFTLNLNWRICLVEKRCICMLGIQYTGYSFDIATLVVSFSELKIYVQSEQC